MQEKSLVRINASNSFLKFAAPVRCGVMIFGVLALLFTSGCAATNRQFGTDLPEGAFDHQTTGAVVGAGVGAGAGAILGSVTGALAPGIIVGATVGGIAGAAIGKHNEDEALALAQAEHIDQSGKRQEIILDQDQEIKKRREDLEDQRGSLKNPNTANKNISSAALAYNRPSVVPVGYTPDNYRGSPKAKSFNAYGSSSSSSQNYRAYGNSASSNQLASAKRVETAKPAAKTTAQVSASSKELVKETPPNHPLLTNLPAEEKQNPVMPVTTAKTSSAASAAGSLPPAKGFTPAEEPKFASKDAVSMDPGAGVDILPQQVPTAQASGVTSGAIGAAAPGAAVAASKNTPTGSVNSPQDLSSNSVQGADCKEAQSEAERALAAASAADKLFYYRRALKLCPQNAAYHVETGKIYVEIERSEDAAFEFRQALDLQPGNSEAKSALSLLDKKEVKVDEGPIVQ